MKTILDRLPFFEAETNLDVRGEVVVIRKYQIIVWVSLVPLRVEKLSADTPKFPAVLDTGNTHNFVLSEAHLNRWAGLEFGPLWFSHTRFNEDPLPLLTARVWLHPNKRGQRDSFSRRPPFPLELPDGIPLFPHHASNAARLPTLGLRALATNDLHLTVDGKQRFLTLRTSRE
jgi:hypothetical protein